MRGGDNSALDDMLRKQTDGPAGKAFRWCRGRQRGQLRLAFAIENSRNWWRFAFFAQEHSIEPLGHEFLTRARKARDRGARRRAESALRHDVLTRKQRATPPIQPIFDGEKQAKLTALACSQPPVGHARWTLRLLAEKVVELEIVEAAHFNTVGRALKKTI